MSKVKNAPVTGASNIKAVIFQDGEVITKDETGKDITYIHSGTLSSNEVKKSINTFLGSLIDIYFKPSIITVGKGETSYTIEKDGKIANLKGIKISFQYNGKQVFLTNKARISSCIGKGIASLNFTKLAFQLLGLIGEITEDSDLLTSIAVTFKAAGKTDSDIAALKNEAKVEIGKTGTKLASIAIRTVRKEVKEYSQYGVYISGIAESKKLLKDAEKKATLTVSK